MQQACPSLLFIAIIRTLRTISSQNYHGSHGNKEKDKKQPADINAELIYKNKCMSCHGGNLEGGAGPGLRHVVVSMSEEEIVNQIVNGGGRMPGGPVDKDQAEVLAKWLSQKK